MPPKVAEKKPTAGKAPAGKAPEKKVCYFSNRAPFFARILVSDSFS